jgi:CRP-like cAMP-binding protein
MSTSPAWRHDPPDNLVPFHSGRASAGRPDGPAPQDVLFRVWGNLAKSKRLAARQMIFLEGEPAEHIYLVTEGRVESVHLSPDGRKFVSFEAGPGDVLGVAALIDGATYPGSAQASCEAAVIRLRGETVAAVLREGGEFSVAFAEALSRRLSQTEERTGQVALSGLETRVASVLIAECEHGAKVVALTHREIAERSGAARESVTQMLNQFKREGMVVLGRGAIHVASIARLAAVAGRGDMRVWLPLVKALPAICATAAACAAMAVDQPTAIAF